MKQVATKYNAEVIMVPNVTVLDDVRLVIPEKAILRGVAVGKHRQQYQSEQHSRTRQVHYVVSRNV
jgi:hypothetical protein